MKINIYDNLLDIQNIQIFSKKKELKVDPLFSSEEIHPNENRVNKQNIKKRRKYPIKNENKDHFEELVNAGSFINKILIRNHVPYRFCIYRLKNEIMIDIVKLDISGKIIKVLKKNITHEDFFDWIRRIENSGGILIDTSM